MQGRRVIFVAPDEWKDGLVRMKDLRTENEDEKQVDLSFAELVEQLAARGIVPLERPIV